MLRRALQPAPRRVRGVRALMLGIETSFDDTCVAVVARDTTGRARILANHRHAQVSAPHGTVPHVAGAMHRAALPGMYAGALAAAGIAPRALTGIAVTVGPGLAPSLAAGLDFARGLAAATGLPLYPVHHMEAHLLTARMVAPAPFPFLTLLATGGHCLLIHAAALGDYSLLGTTLDDSPGEAFDKVARALGLSGGGAGIEAAAAAARASGVVARASFATPLQRERTCDFSFAGLKTNIFRQIYGPNHKGGVLAAGQAEAARWLHPCPADVQLRGELALTLQATVAHHLSVRTARAVLFARRHFSAPPVALVASGGVLANATIHAALHALGRRLDLPTYSPPRALCTDNAAMIAWTALEYQQARSRSGVIGGHGSGGPVPPIFLPGLRYHPEWPLGADLRAAVGSAAILVPNNLDKAEL